MFVSRVIATVAASGVFLTVVGSIGLWVGVDLFGARATWLFVGLVAVHTATILVLRAVIGPSMAMPRLRTMLIGLPRWQYRAIVVALVYGGSTFAVALLGVFPNVSGGSAQLGTGPLILFYCHAWAVNAARVGRAARGIVWECEHGHPLVPDLQFCPACGAPARSPSPRATGEV